MSRELKSRRIIFPLKLEFSDTLHLTFLDVKEIGLINNFAKAAKKLVYVPEPLCVLSI